MNATFLKVEMKVKQFLKNCCKKPMQKGEREKGEFRHQRQDFSSLADEGDENDQETDQNAN